MNDYTTHGQWVDNTVRRDHQPGHVNGALVGAVIAVVLGVGGMAAIVIAIVGQWVTR